MYYTVYTTLVLVELVVSLKMSSMVHWHQAKLKLPLAAMGGALYYCTWIQILQAGKVEVSRKNQRIRTLKQYTYIKNFRKGSGMTVACKKSSS